MRLHKTVMTTGEVARICNVAPRTVSKWFDTGQLRGYRIPGSKDRRIPIDQLRRFMQTHGIPLNGLDTGEVRVLILDEDPVLAEAAKNALSSHGPYQVASADSAFEAGALATELQPHVFVLDVTRQDVIPESVVRWVRSRQGPDELGVIAMATGMSDPMGQSFIQEGFDAYLSKPFDIHSLIELIEDTAIRGRVQFQ